jgi:hypothetical protein
MWRKDIENAPAGERILVRNELWDETHGAVQIAANVDGKWQFDSDLCLDLTQDDIEHCEDEPLTPADFQPKEWMLLPT